MNKLDSITNFPDTMEVTQVIFEGVKHPISPPVKVQKGDKIIINKDDSDPRNPIVTVETIPPHS